MKKKRAASGFVFAVLTMGSYGITAQAATQTQSQALYSQQGQQATISDGGSVVQGQSSSTTTDSQQTQSTAQPAQGEPSETAGTNSSSVLSDQSHSVTGAGSFTQKQQASSLSEQPPVTPGQSVTNGTMTQTTSTQNGSLTTSTKATVSQNYAVLVETSQSQSPAGADPTKSNTPTASTVHTSTGPVYSANYYLLQSVLQLRSSYSSSQVAGYAIFDKNGHMLSDTYGIFPSANNNFLNQYESFATSKPTGVVIMAVNAWGQPVNNPFAMTVYLRSNNFNSFFLDPNSGKITNTFVLPAGADGLEVGYVNAGANAQFDVLDVGVDNPNRIMIRSTKPGIETQQSQSATSGNSSATETQTTVAISNQSQTGSTGTNQSENVTQSADSTQSQALTTAGTNQLSENQQSSVNAKQTATDGTAQGGTWSADAAQTVSGTVGSTGNLAQNQSVSVNDSVINVTFAQNNSVSDSTLTLNETVNATGTTDSSSPSPTKVVNVTVGGAQKQYTVTSDAAVTFNESQSANTADPSNVAQSISMDYTSNGQRYTISIS